MKKNIENNSQDSIVRGSEQVDKQKKSAQLHDRKDALSWWELEERNENKNAIQKLQQDISSLRKEVANYIENTENPDLHLEKKLQNIDIASPENIATVETTYQEFSWENESVVFSSPVVQSSWQSAVDSIQQSDRSPAVKKSMVSIYTDMQSMVTTTVQKVFPSSRVDFFS